MADRTGTAFYAAWTLAAYSSQIERIGEIVRAAPQDQTSDAATEWSVSGGVFKLTLALQGEARAIA
jgi:hypothetical protein